LEVVRATLACVVPALLAGLFFAAAPAHADRRVALVIGNAAYVTAPRLGNPDSDARLIANTLRSLGFILVGGGAQLDLNEEGFRHAIEEFGRQLQGADVGLFYYAGHGMQVRGENFLVPVDANPTKEADIDFQMVDANLVVRQMEDAGTKLNLVILDACRNNPFGGRGLRSVASGLATMNAPEGTLISFATQPGSVAQDGTDGHSPYTEALARTLREPGVDIFRTFNDVGLAVEKATGGAQEPWVSHSPISGDFYFSSLPASKSAPPNYSDSVTQRLLAAKQFPPNGPRGQDVTSLVRFTVVPDGSVTMVRLVRSSGITVFDDAALALIQRAVPFPSPPHGQQITFTIPVRYESTMAGAQSGSKEPPQQVRRPLDAWDYSGNVVVETVNACFALKARSACQADNRCSWSGTAKEGVCVIAPQTGFAY
jgi:TonB family protein